MSHRVIAPWARIDHVWHPHVLLGWDHNGTLTEVNLTPTAQDRTALPYLAGPVMPGMPNLHSHAFQSAMAGLTEYRGQAQDSFWSWRDLMYRFAAKLQPEHIAAIAHWLYIQMLKAGYTSVCEFHYVHHQSDGTPYACSSTLAHAVMQAAQQSGIGITLLPVLYQYSGFGAQAPRADQERFLNSPDQLLQILLELQKDFPANAQRAYGVAPHSLRAVSPESLQQMVQLMDAHFPNSPIHIHIAEQMAEVNACMAQHQQRPVEWLLNQFDVDQRWCLVHATHLNSSEIRRTAASGAVAGLCLTTEANLGDGLFPAQAYLAAHGRIGVGSDSHIAVDWRAELRLLEYGQRLIHQQRNVLCSEQQPSVADYLFDACVSGGAQASGRAINGLYVGQQADFLVLNTDDVILAEHTPETWLSTLVFNERAGSLAIRDVYVAGCPVIKQGRHAHEDEAWHNYRNSLNHLLQND